MSHRCIQCGRIARYKTYSGEGDTTEFTCGAYPGCRTPTLTIEGIDPQEAASSKGVSPGPGTAPVAGAASCGPDICDFSDLPRAKCSHCGGSWDAPLTVTREQFLADPKAAMNAGRAVNIVDENGALRGQIAGPMPKGGWCGRHQEPTCMGCEDGRHTTSWRWVTTGMA